MTIDKAAAFIRAHGMTAPAIFFLEMYKPFAGVAANLMNFCAPLAKPFINGGENTLALLESREFIEALIVRLEAEEERGRA